MLLKFYDKIFQENVISITVSVEQGILEGGQKWTVTGDASYIFFKGIPYAAPPIGNLRFKVRFFYHAKSKFK